MAVTEMTDSNVPLYKRDPEAWEAYLAEGNAKQARKRVSADVLIRDNLGRILLVDPGYKPGWDLPGGMAEANEPPSACVQREIKEELGLEIHLGRPLCMEWVPPHGPWDDMIAFIFDGGVLEEEDISSLQLLDGELDQYEFCSEEEAQHRLSSRTGRRLQAAIDAARNGVTAYLEPLGQDASKAAETSKSSDENLTKQGRGVRIRRRLALLFRRG